MLAHGRRPCERDESNAIIRNQVIGDLIGYTEYHIEDSRRQPGIVKGSRDMQRSCRSFFRRLDDDRASGRQRAADLAGRLAKRKVPRREGRDRTYWLSDYHVPDTRLARYYPAVGALTLCGIPLEELATTNDLE